MQNPSNFLLQENSKPEILLDRERGSLYSRVSKCGRKALLSVGYNEE
jgi:hypothetical protein